MPVVQMGKNNGTTDAKVWNIFDLPRGSCDVLVLLKMREGRKGTAVVNVGGGPVKLICARLSDLIKDCATRAAEFRAEVRGLDIDLLNGVGIGDDLERRRDW